MVICTIMRMLEGINCRILEMKKPENAVTSVSAMHITTVTRRDVVTASAEQIPNICSAIGLFLTIGSTSVSRILMTGLPVADFPAAAESLARPASSARAYRHPWS